MKKLVFALLLCSLLSPLWADVFPKPEVHFSFIYNTENKPLIDPAHSEQIQCKDSLCLESDPLGAYGVQKLTCGAGQCTSTAYRFDPYQKLVISFTDGSSRESNIFRLPKDLYTRYNVYVQDNKLLVEPSGYHPSVEERLTPSMWLALQMLRELLNALLS